MKYVTIGCSFLGNKGAASMLEAAIQTLSRADPKASFSLLSLYPQGDAELNKYDALEVLRADPVYLGVVINSLALLYRILPPLRGLLCRNRQIRTIAEADVFLDQGGITFVDGREVFLLYNIASILPALMIGTPIVKCSQAMGPFKGRLNRSFARVFLPRMTKILARGERTMQHLAGLGLSNVERVADYAFCLDVGQAEAEAAQSVLDRFEFRESCLNVGVFPSEVLRDKLAGQGVDYEIFMAELIDRIIADYGATVYLIPHSLRARDKRRNNDVPVCDNIHQRVRSRKSCRYVTDLTCSQQLRHVIGRLDLAIVARFHAMVSALSTATPVFVTGWSHKYQEVLDMFELEACVQAESQISVDALLAGFARTFENREEIRKRIQERLPEVRQSALRHTEIISRAVRAKKVRDADAL